MRAIIPSMGMLRWLRFMPFVSALLMTGTFIASVVKRYGAFVSVCIGFCATVVCYWAIDSWRWEKKFTEIRRRIDEEWRRTLDEQ